jgi:hypothetical protein
MSLILRRGTDAQRQTITFEQGEVIYTTDTQKLYVGDGVTLGGKHMLATSAGVGVTFNPTTQRLDFTTSNLGLTTSDVAEGTNKYFTTQRAQAAAAALLTATGAPSKTGNVTGVNSNGTVTISGTTTSGMVQGETFVVAGTGGNGLTAGTYYVCAILTGTTLTISSTRPNAFAGAPLLSFTTGSLTGTTFGSGAEDTAITFVYDSVNQVIRANVALDGVGIASLSADPAPTLGGGLGIGNYSITSSGTGVINITGNITSGGTVQGSTVTGTSVTGTTVTAGNLSLNGNSLSTTSGTLLVKNSAYNMVEFRGINANGSNLTVPQFNIFNTRGTLIAPQSAQAGDYIGLINFGSYIVNNYSAVSSITSQIDPTANLADNKPASNIAFVTNGGGNNQNLAYFSYKGIFNAPRLLVTSYGTGSYPSSPQAGEIIYNSTTNHFFGYNGTSWVQFTGP